MVQTVAEKSTTINSKTWDALLRFLLAVNDVLLAPPTEKGLHRLTFYLTTVVMQHAFAMWCAIYHSCVEPNVP